MSEYSKFLASKRPKVYKSGFQVYSGQINPLLFPYQRDVVRWALSEKI